MELNDVEFVAFIKALLKKQFEGKEPTDLKGMSKFAYLSQKFSIDKQVFGFETKTGTILHPTQDPTQDPMADPTQDPTVQEKEKEKGKEKEKEEREEKPSPIILFNYKKCTDKEFIQELSKFVEKYGKDTVNSFYRYWSDKNEKGKMRIALQDTFEISKRIATWKEKETNFNKSNKFDKTDSLNPKGLKIQL